MNDDPTTINIIINNARNFSDVIVDLSTGPETDRIGWSRFYSHDIDRALGSDWEGWIREDPIRFIKQFSNIKSQLKHPPNYKAVESEKDIKLLSSFLWKHDRPPTFNEWEKEKLMTELQ